MSSSLKPFSVNTILYLCCWHGRVIVRLEPSNTCRPLPLHYQSTYSQHVIASQNPGFRRFACPVVFIPSLFHHQPLSVHIFPSLFLHSPNSCCFVQNPVLTNPCLYQRGFREQHLPWWQRQFVLNRRFAVTGLHSKHNVIYADNYTSFSVTKIFAVSRNGIVNYVEIKCQLDATDDIYCRFYCMLNMFRAILCPSSGYSILFPHNNDDARSKSLQMELLIFKFLQPC